ncbi:hypothetical protein HEK616_71460 [Streptomyces nigrescens]|uniref:Guanylate cyclase domain-containing protein n=2 Tax=Streptomyces TaxID=1883 RepID=A0ABN6R5H8_STRNI|nr:hypothetical protein [Streptomyces nigrescens]MEE4424325.1 hypothetical protein [Streptomyces sp. DSM 41528]BDM73659.1 hypothetical protein HEK616_71460 [Streptomyces nigrescens]
MDDGARDVAEAHYELVISVDARRSGEYDDVDRPRMRARIYRILETAFNHAKVARDAVHMEDRGDGVLLSVAGRIAVTRLLGLWMVEVRENLRDENRGLRVPLGLRVGMNVGPVVRDGRGVSGRAVDLACRLADSPVGRQLLDAERADLVLVVSESLYEDVVRSGGKFIEPARYSRARLALKEGAVTAWFHLPGRDAPAIPDGLDPGEGRTRAVRGAGDAGGGAAGGGAGVADVDGRDGEDEQDDEDGGEDGDRDGGGGSGGSGGSGGDRYVVRGDMSRHENNVYHQGVHIGRITGDTERRKG